MKENDKERLRKWECKEWENKNVNKVVIRVELEEKNKMWQKEIKWRKWGCKINRSEERNV